MGVFDFRRMEKPLKLKFIYAKITRIHIHNFLTIHTEWRIKKLREAKDQKCFECLYRLWNLFSGMTIFIKNFIDIYGYPMDFSASAKLLRVRKWEFFMYYGYFAQSGFPIQQTFSFLSASLLIAFIVNKYD
jgi:hypothetical protein